MATLFGVLPGRYGIDSVTALWPRYAKNAESCVDFSLMFVVPSVSVCWSDRRDPSLRVETKYRATATMTKSRPHVHWEAAGQARMPFDVETVVMLVQYLILLSSVVVVSVPMWLSVSDDNSF